MGKERERGVLWGREREKDDEGRAMGEGREDACIVMKKNYEEEQGEERAIGERNGGRIMGRESCRKKERKDVS